MLNIDVEKTGDVAVVRCGGRIVRGEEVRSLRSAVLSEKASRIVVLDLSEVETLDAGGLTTLLSLHQWACNRGMHLKLVNPTRFVRDVLFRTRLDQVLEISTLTDALFVLRAPVPLCHTRLAVSC